MDTQEENWKKLRGDAKVIVGVFGAFFFWLLYATVPQSRTALWYAFVFIVSIWGGKYIGMFLMLVLDDLLHNVIGLPRPPQSHPSTPESHSSSPHPPH